MAVIIIFPSDPLDDEMLALLTGRVREYFKTADLMAYVMGKSLDSYKADGFVAVRPASALDPEDGDIIVAALEADGSLPKFEYATRSNIAEFFVDRMGRIFSCKSMVTNEEYPHQEAHVFNRLGWREPGNGFYYYPYGYLFRDTSVGEVDSLGFRIPSDLSFLVDRPKTHKVVVVFGGSAAFSMYSSFSEMFSSVLEQKLMNSLEPRNSVEKITVLNFGMHGNILINEIMSFILYCNTFKPDVVIAHDGWNDFAYGLISDTHLLEQWDVVYQYNLETWSQFIHASYDRPVNLPISPYEPFNLACSVLRSYMIRKRQFADIVKGTGAYFIWGVQPTIYNKLKISQKEKDRTMLGVHGMGAFSKVYPKVKVLYDLYLEAMRANSPEFFIDFPKIFAQLDGSVTHFADHVHTVPEGDRLIAEVYKEALMPLLFVDQDIAGLA